MLVQRVKKGKNSRISVEEKS